MCAWHRRNAPAGSKHHESWWPVAQPAYQPSEKAAIATDCTATWETSLLEVTVANYGLCPWIILPKAMDFHLNMSACMHQTYLKLCSCTKSFSITSRGVSSKEVCMRLRLINSMAYKDRMRCFLQIRNYYGFLNELSVIHYSEAIHVRKIIILKSNLFKQPYDAPRHRKKKKKKKPHNQNQKSPDWKHYQGC